MEPMDTLTFLNFKEGKKEKRRNSQHINNALL